MLHIYVFPKEHRCLLEEPTKIYGLNTKTTKKTGLDGFSRIITISPKTLKNLRNKRNLQMYQINENVKLVINSKKLTHPTPPFCSMKNWDLVDAFVYALTVMFNLRDFTSV
jgi:hypothetical protein